ncbi:hypothetical protein GCM10025867_46940 (plasmid) [Frondihabitans sucicola]|uniref:Uncharacterized protein n=2 Tax=Frondihabitans sucicola TaxID=1268041 RepID=A0ABN6Y5K2_9MICO|nr:hypothetical protein GCM10025867_46940 [Frondihabitans sucicola]
MYLAASIAAMLVSAVLAYFIPTSWGVVHEIIVVPLHAITAVSLIVALISGITMNSLRTERLRVGKTQKESRLGRFFKFN